jgi:hypothetical protein
MTKDITVRVRCSGHLHQITLTEKGALVLHDHLLPEEQAMIALGGASCRCMQVLKAWRESDRRALPAGLRPAFDVKERKRISRQRQRSIDPLTIPLRVRMERYIISLAQEALEQCGYRRSQSSWAGGDHNITVRIQDDRPAAMTGGSEPARSKNGKWSGTNSYVAVSIPLCWYSKVYRRGLAVVDDCFVLDVIDGTVLAGKQSRGFAVLPRRARIIASDDGLCLRWLKGEKQ